MSALVPAGPPAWVAVVTVAIVYVIWLIYRNSRTSQDRSTNDEAKIQVKPQSSSTDRQSDERTDMGYTGKPRHEYVSVDGLYIADLKRQGRLDEARDLLQERMKDGEEESARHGRTMAPYAVYRDLMIVLRKQKAYAEVVRVLEHMATLTESSPKYWGEPSKLPGLLAKARADAERQRLAPEPDKRETSPERRSTREPRSPDSRRQPTPGKPTPDSRVLPGRTAAGIAGCSGWPAARARRRASHHPAGIPWT